MAADTDLATEQAEDKGIEAKLGNPLKAALAGLRNAPADGEGSEQDEEKDESQADEGAEDAEEQDAGDTQPDESEGESDDKADKPAKDDEADEDEEGDKPKGKAPKLSTVDIPMPNADGSRGPRGTGTITLEGVPQEAADALRHYMKEAERLPLVEQQLQATQADAQIADFVESDPLAAMTMIYDAQPDVADEFVKTWMKINAVKIPAFIKELELEDMTERELKLVASNTKRDAVDGAQKKFGKHQDGYKSKTDADRLLVTITNLATTANIPETDQEEFLLVASRRIAKLYRENPRITERDVIVALQPTVQKYQKVPTPTNKKPDVGKNPAKVFAQKAQKNRKMVVVGSGKSPVPQVGGLKKPPKGTTLNKALTMLKRNEL